MNCDPAKLSLLLLMNFGTALLYHRNQPFNIRDTFSIKARVSGIIASSLLQAARPWLENSSLEKHSVKPILNASPFLILGGVFALTGLAWRVNLFTTTLFGIQHLFTYNTLSPDPSSSPVSSVVQSKFALLFSCGMTLLYWQSQKPHYMYSNPVKIRVVGIAISFIAQDWIHSHIDEPNNSLKKLALTILPFSIIGGVFALTKLPRQVNLLATILIGGQQSYVYSSKWKEPAAYRVKPLPLEKNPGERTGAPDLPQKIEQPQIEGESVNLELERMRGILAAVAEEIGYSPPLSEELAGTLTYSDLVKELHDHLEKLKKKSQCVEDLKAQLYRVEQDHSKELDAIKNGARDAIEAIRKEEQKTYETLAAAIETRFRERREGLRKKLVDLRQELKRMEISRAAYQEENAQLPQEKKRWNKILNKYKQRAEKAEALLIQKDAHLTSEQAVIERFKQKIVELERTQAALEADLEYSLLEESFSAIDSEEYQTHYYKTQGENSELNKRIEELEAELSATRAYMEKIQAENAKLGELLLQSEG